MKYTLKISLAAILMLCAVSAGAEKIRTVSVNNAFIDINNKELPALAKYGDFVNVAFDLAVPTELLKSREGFVVTPVIHNGSYELELPPVLVFGRNYKLVTAGREQFDKIQFPDYIIEERYNQKGMILSYRYTVPFDERMKGSTLTVSQVKYCACGDIQSASSEDFWNKGIIDYTNLIRTEGMHAYYIQHVDKHTYDDVFDAQTESIFAVDSPVLNEEVFLNGEYANFKALLKKSINDKNMTISKVELYTASSPEGDFNHNAELASQRSAAIYNFVMDDLKTLSFDKSIITRNFEAENWQGFEAYIDGFDNADEIRRIVEKVKDPDAREDSLKVLPNFNKILEAWQNLRYCHIKVKYEVEQPEVILDGGHVIIGSDHVIIDQEDAMRRLTQDDTEQNVNNVMVAYMERGKFEAAKKYANKLLESEVTPEVLNNLGVLYVNLGDYDRARALFEKSQEVPGADYNLGVTLLLLGHYDKAAKVLANYDNNMAVIAALCVDDYDSAANKAAICEESALSYYLMSIIYARRGDTERTRYYLAAAVKSDPNYKVLAGNQAEFIQFRDLEFFKPLIEIQ